MNDHEFYQKLASLDRGIADRWKSATGGKLSTIIGEQALDAIILPTMKTNKITASQAQALVMLFYPAKLSDVARDNLRTYIIIAYQRDFFFAGSAKPLIKGADLQPIYAALGIGSIGKINFVSPQTRLAYTPDLYGAIRWLVSRGDIKVFEVDAAALLFRVGVYRSDINRLILYKGLSPQLTIMSIVHEVTHAIQDWRNLVSTHKYIEADAYIAGAVAALSTDPNYAFLEYPAQKHAAELVLAGQAIGTNKAWTDAYADVVTAVEADPVYADIKDSPYKGSDNEFYDEAAALKKALIHFKVDDALARFDLYGAYTEVSGYMQRWRAHGGG